MTSLGSLPVCNDPVGGYVSKWRETLWYAPDNAPENRPVHARASHVTGPYVLPFPVIQRGGRWFNARLGTELQVEIVGWRPA